MPDNPPPTLLSDAALPGRPDPVERFARRLVITVAALLLIVLSVYLLRTFATLLQQLCVAALLGYLILPLHRWLVRRGLSGMVASFVLLGLFVIAAYLLGRAVYASVDDLAARVPQYRRVFVSKLDEIADGIPSVDRDTLQKLVLGEERAARNPVAMTRAAFGTFVDFLQQTVMVLIYLAFLLLEQGRIPYKIAVGFGPDRADSVLGLVRSINQSIGEYLAIKTAVSLQVAVLTGVVLWLLDVDYALLWAILAFLANYIPILGSVIGIVPPSILALVQYGELWRGLVVAALLTTIQQVVGFVVEPRMAGDRLDLSPLVVVVALSIGGAVWGIIGMLLAVPVAAVIKIVLEHVPETRPIAFLLSNPSPTDRPANRFTS
jgi:predicted PurR-regulated permease PerM